MNIWPSGGGWGVRDPGCPDCQAITSGDCGQHGPVMITGGASNPPGHYPDGLYRVMDGELYRILPGVPPWVKNRKS